MPYVYSNGYYPINHGKYWSREEDRYIRRCFARGRSIKNIARDLGRTREAVRLRILGN